MTSWFHGPVQVRVCASSANIGPGFDALALALSWFDEITAQVDDAGTSVTISGEGENDLPRDEQHLVVHAMTQACRFLQVPTPPVALTCVNRIRQGRGLGSSAAAAVAGVLVARGLVRGADAVLNREQVVNLAAAIDGHADNVAACVYGGAVAAWGHNEGFRVVPLPIHSSIRPVVCVADYEVSTASARQALPQMVPHQDAAATAGRAALLTHALAQEPGLLVDATQDWLHQPYREHLMPASTLLRHKLAKQDIPAVISGAGPSVLALATSPEQVSLALECANDDFAGHRFTARSLPVGFPASVDRL